MKRPVNFTPGPSQLYFTVEDHARRAFREGVPSLSHRSKAFEKIFHSCTEGLRALIQLPADYEIYFTGSATEIWERIIENLVKNSSFHFVNGSFSQRFHEIALQLKRNAEKMSAAPGEGFTSLPSIAGETELIAITHNETSTGVSLPLGLISELRRAYPEMLLAVDAVSSLPYPEFDFGLIDTAFFSVQKAFGLPAGLGVWMVNQRCISKAERLTNEGVTIGTYHAIPSLSVHARKHQTPETPNVLGIYLLDAVVQDMLRRGIGAIRKETEYKAALLYQTLEQHGAVRPFVQDERVRSKTVIVAECGDHTEHLRTLLGQQGLVPGDGYGPFKKTQLRFANFPTHSKEQYELLVDTLQKG